MCYDYSQNFKRVKSGVDLSLELRSCRVIVLKVDFNR